MAITIVVLMILAGVSITMVTDDEGVVTKSKTAAQETELASIKEDIQTSITKAIVAERGNLSDSELESILNNYGELNSDKTTLTTSPTKTNTEYSYEIKLSDLYLGSTTEDDVTKYTVRFYNYDGTFLAQTRVNAGTVASYSGAMPTKPGTETATYTFANKWANESGEEADISSVQKDMDVYAMFNESIKEDVPSVELATVMLLSDVGTSYSVELTYEVGMTWEQFVNSDYNNISECMFSINDDSTISCTWNGISPYGENFASYITKDKPMNYATYYYTAFGSKCVYYMLSDVTQ